MKIDFKWHRCVDGYQVADVPGEGKCIGPKSDNMETYNPFERVWNDEKEYYPALLNQLSSVKTEADMIKFANKFGLLFHPKELEPLESWASFSETMRNMLKEWDQGKLGSLGRYFNDLKFGKVDVRLDTSERPPKWSATLNDLHHAIWWQFVQMAISGQDQEECAWCHTWFAVGPDTGRRKRRSNVANSYCNDKHGKRHKYSILKGSKK